MLLNYVCRAYGAYAIIFITYVISNWGIKIMNFNDFSPFCVSCPFNIQIHHMTDYEKKEIDAAWQGFRKTIRRRRIRRGFAFLTACLILPFLVWGLVKDGLHDTDMTPMCVSGSGTVLLPDGTRVVLSQDSRIYYPRDFGQDGRRVSLDGTAYFEVESSPELPFIVEAAGGYIKVTGTRFLATASENNSLRVNLEEGCLELGVEGGEPVHLLPSEEVEYSTATMQVVESDLAFKDETLEVVLEKISKIYGFEYRFADESAKNHRLLFRIPKYEKPAKIIHLIETVCNIDAVYSDGTLTIY
jgi:ferric-dicitrate binding protein FerR (iron transport regulator)